MTIDTENEKFNDAKFKDKIQGSIFFNAWCKQSQRIKEIIFKIIY